MALSLPQVHAESAFEPATRRLKRKKLRPFHKLCIMPCVLLLFCCSQTEVHCARLQSAVASALNCPRSNYVFCATYHSRAAFRTIPISHQGPWCSTTVSDHVSEVGSSSLQPSANRQSSHYPERYDGAVSSCPSADTTFQWLWRLICLDTRNLSLSFGIRANLLFLLCANGYSTGTGWQSVSLSKHSKHTFL